MNTQSRHETLGLLIEEELRHMKVNIVAMCQEIHMGHTTYSDLKGGSDKHLKYYEGILDCYCNTLTEEEILEKVQEWALMYIRYRKEKELSKNKEGYTHGGVES